MEVFFCPRASLAGGAVNRRKHGVEQGEGWSQVQTVAPEVASPASHYSLRPGSHGGGRKGSVWLVVDGDGREVPNTLVVSRFGDVLMTVAGS